MTQDENVMNNFYAILDISGWGDISSFRNRGIFIFPTGREFAPFTNAKSWQEVQNYPVLTDRLWAYSLKYSWWLFQNGYRDLAVKTVNTFYESSLESEETFEKYLPGSWDHAVSIRLALLACMLPNATFEEHEAIRNYIRLELNWALTDGNVKDNNHGFMLVVSILIASVSLSKFADPISEELKVFGIIKFKEIIHAVFGDDDYCNENSPFYAHFYVHTLKKIARQFSEVEGMQEFTSFVNTYISSSQETLEKIIHPNAAIPPMGDSSEMNTRYKSIPGIHYSTRTGFWVHKKRDRYLSFKCGFDSLVHKHADDTSITLQINGKDFLVDSGFCNYNYSDSRVISLRTQKAHSGVYYSELDNEYPARLYKAPIFAVSGLVVKNTREVTGWQILAGDNYISRTLKLVSDTKFTITDEFHTTSYAEPIRRFIVPFEVNVEIRSSGVRLRNGNEWVDMEFSENVKTVITSGVTGKEARGWISKKANSIIPAKCIEVISLNHNKLPIITFATS